MSDGSDISGIVLAFTQSNISISDFLFTILTTSTNSERFLRTDLLIHGDAICDALLHHPLRPDASLQWANEFVKSKYANEISALVDRDNGLHFSASTASAQQISDFRIEEMAKKMQVLAPHVWNLLDTLLSALRKPNFTTDSEGDLVMDPPVDVDEDLEYYGDTNIEGIINLLDEATVKTPEERRIYRLDAILTVVRRLYLIFYEQGY